MKHKLKLINPDKPHLNLTLVQSESLDFLKKLFALKHQAGGEWVTSRSLYLRYEGAKVFITSFTRDKVKAFNEILKTIEGDVC